MLEDVTISLEAGTTPQLITGQARFGWADKTQIDVDLASGAVTITSEAPVEETAVKAAVDEAGYELVSH